MPVSEHGPESGDAPIESSDVPEVDVPEAEVAELEVPEVEVAEVEVPEVEESPAVDESLPEQGQVEAEPEQAQTEEVVSKQQLDVEEEHEAGIASRKLLTWGAILGLLYLVISVLDVVWASYRVTEASAPAAVVLGAAQYNGEPSEALRRRLDRAAELYNDGRVDLLVVTGGGQEADVTTEAKSGYDYLREAAGIPDEDLRLEVQGSSTYESLAAVERFLEPEGIEDVILVTDRYHARRSQLIADEVGLNAAVYPTDGDLSVGRVATESAAVAAGRVTGFRRLNNYVVG